MGWRRGIFLALLPAKSKKTSPFYLNSFGNRNFFRFYFVYLHHILVRMENKKLNRLRVVMAEKDLSNMWLSENLGVCQATVSKWVTNFSQPNLEMLIKISKLLEVNVNDLIRPEEVVIEKKTEQ